jgi:hypothetical protein
MGTSSSEKEKGEMKERTSGDSNEAVVAEGDVTRGRRVAMSVNHTEGEKQKENALRIRRDALID